MIGDDGGGPGTAEPRGQVRHRATAATASARRRSSAASRRSSASISPPSPAPGRTGGSPRRTCARPRPAALRPEGRREPLRGVRRADRRAPRPLAPRGARGHRRSRSATSPALDLDRGELRTRSSLRATRALAAGVPGAERPARGRRDRLPRPLRPRRRGADRRRASSSRSSAAATPPSLEELDAEVHAPRRGRRAPGRSRPRSCAARPSPSRARASSAGSSPRRSSTTPRSAILGVHRIAPRPVVRDGEVVVRAGRQRLRHVRPPRRRRRRARPRSAST